MLWFYLFNFIFFLGILLNEKMDEKLLDVLQQSPVLSVFTQCKQYNVQCFCFVYVFLFFTILFFLVSSSSRNPALTDSLSETNMQNLKNSQLLFWPIVSSQIIDVCLAFHPLALPPYVLLEIIDWFPFYEYVDHKKKIDLILDLNKSISEIFKNKKQ